MIYAPCFIFILLFARWTLGFQFGYSPKSYLIGEHVPLLANKVESDHTQIPYGYYDLSFVCPSPHKNSPIELSLGAVLRGERSVQSGYELYFGVDKPCVRLCDMIMKKKGISRADELIRNEHSVHWTLDGLPGARTFESGRNKYYSAGFPLGYVSKGMTFYHNHVVLVVRYHSDKAHPGKYHIVGFEVYPKSVRTPSCPSGTQAYDKLSLNSRVINEKNGRTSIEKKEEVLIPYTYSVYWREDVSIDYESRWDLYYENESAQPERNAHIFSLTNSALLLCLLSVIVWVIFSSSFSKNRRSLSQDLPLIKGDRLNTDWRVLVSEVLVNPKFKRILTLLVAAGIQVLVAAIGALVITIVNSKVKHQEALISFLIFCLLVSGLISSYFGIILQKIINDDNLNIKYPNKTWIIASVFYSGTLPAYILSVVLFLNFFLWAKHSSDALPFGTIVTLVLLLLIEVPLGIMGGYLGNKKSFHVKSFLIRTRSNARLKAWDSKQSLKNNKFSWVLNPIASTLIFGLLPFGIIYIELSFVLNTVWLVKTSFYYMYGFLLITTIALVLAVIETTIVGIYLSLAVFNNPRWHWLCFRVGSSIGWYMFGYSAYCFSFLKMRDIVSAILYFSYMALVSTIVGLCFGSVGVLTGLIFIRKLIGLTKID